MASRRRNYRASSSESSYARRSNTPRKGESSSSGYSSANPYSRRHADEQHAAISRRAESRRTDASAYSRHSNARVYSRRRAKNKRKKRITIAVAVVVALFAVGVASAAAYINSINSALSSDVDEELESVLADVTEVTDPFYVLIMGVDKSEERDESGTTDGSYRSDSMILARIDPANQQITLVSIVRDTYVEIPGYGYGKINAAYAYGGAALAVETVSNFAGVEIAHYVEIDFDGFEAVVDALGGIEVTVSVDIDDDEAGGSISAGTQTLNGEQALILCRSRHAYDSYGSGDFYRAANQRMVLGAIAEKLLASDAATIASTIMSLVDYVTTDMSVTEIISVAVALQGMDTDENIYSTMNPTVSTYVDSIWYEYSNDEAWTTMMERIDQGLSPTPDEDDSSNDGAVTDGSISGEYIANSVLYGTSSDAVTVLNGSGVAGAAGDAADVLEEAGYEIAETADADSYDYTTTLVIYNDEDDEDTATAIVEALGTGALVENDGTYDFDGGYLVIVGTDYSS